MAPELAPPGCGSAYGPPLAALERGDRDGGARGLCLGRAGRRARGGARRPRGAGALQDHRPAARHRLPGAGDHRHRGRYIEQIRLERHYLPAVRYHEIANAGHLVMWEQVTATNRLITEFLADMAREQSAS